MQYNSKLLPPPLFLVPHANKMHRKNGVPGPLTSFPLFSYLFLFSRRPDKMRFVISTIKLYKLVH